MGIRHPAAAASKRQRRRDRLHASALAPTQFTLTVIDGSRIITGDLRVRRRDERARFIFTTDGEYVRRRSVPSEPRWLSRSRARGRAWDRSTASSSLPARTSSWSGFDQVIDRSVTGEEQTPVDEPVIRSANQSRINRGHQQPPERWQHRPVPCGHAEQYRGDAPTTGPNVPGSDIVVEIERSTSTDSTQPTVDGVSATMSAIARSAVRVTTSDPDGIGHINVFDTQGTTLAEVSDSVRVGAERVHGHRHTASETSPAIWRCIVNVTHRQAMSHRLLGKGYTIKPIDVALASAGDVLLVGRRRSPSRSATSRR